MGNPGPPRNRPVSMIVDAHVKRLTQALVAERARGGVIDEADARAIVAEIRERFPEVATGEDTRSAAMSSLWHRLHGSDYFVQGEGGGQKVRVLPTADPTEGACAVFNEFARSLPALPGADPDGAGPLRFGDASRQFVYERPDVIVRRDLDGSARIGERPDAAEAPAPATTPHARANDAERPSAATLSSEDVVRLASMIQTQLRGGAPLLDVDLSQTPLRGARMQVVASQASVQIFVTSASAAQKKALRAHRHTLVRGIDHPNVRLVA